MSAIDDEFGVGEDLESLLSDSTIPAKKQTAGRKGVPGKADQIVPVELPNSAVLPPETPTVTNISSVGLTLDDIRGLFGEMKESLRTELRQEMSGADKSPTSPQSPDLLVAAPTVVEPGTGTLIHFVEDGFTIGQMVYYRGQEYTAPEDATWPRLTAMEQIRRYGRRYFREGPWDGVGFDLSDPSLTDQDRARLAALAR